jgi:outer membrane autotransporter protein
MTLAPNALRGTGFWARQLIADNYGSQPGSGADGYSSRGVHTAFGFDAVVSSRTTFGVSTVYTRDEMQLDQGRTQPSSVRTPHLMAYASHTRDSMQLRGVIGCGDHAYESQRTVVVGSTSSVLSSSHHATECSAYAQAEFGRGEGARQLRPLVGLLYSRLDAGRYVETGGADSLAIAGYVAQSVASNAGLRFTQSLADHRGAFEARAIWSHEFADANPTMRAALASDTSGADFTVQGVAQGRDSGVVGAGLAMQLRNSFLFHTDYNVELSSDHRVRQTVAAGFSFVY